MKSPLKYFGGKYYLAANIVKLFPKDCLHYVEPYAGSLAVLLENPNFVDKSEVVNDLWGSLTVFWKVLQDESLFSEFKQRVVMIPFSEVEWDQSYNVLDSKNTQQYVCSTQVDEAIAFFICNRQSRGGEFKTFATLSKNRTRGGMNEQVSAWLSCVERLPELHERLKRVAVLNHDALDVIKQEDTKNTLFYLDPPYLPESRTSTGQYLYEMTIEQHSELLSLLRRLKGRFLLSSYPNALYDNYLSKHLNNYHSVDFVVNKPSASGGIAIERVYMNY